LDISTDLANEGRVTIAVKVVILNLEILAKRNQDIVALLEGFFTVDASLMIWRAVVQQAWPHIVVFVVGLTHHVQSKDDGKVEGVESGLVNDDELMPKVR
jgi:hypothetical protein